MGEYDDKSDCDGFIADHVSFNLILDTYHPHSAPAVFHFRIQTDSVGHNWLTIEDGHLYAMVDRLKRMSDSQIARAMTDQCRRCGCDHSYDEFLLMVAAFRYGADALVRSVVVQ